MNKVIKVFLISIIITSCSTKKSGYFYSAKNLDSAQEVLKKVNNSIKVPDKISLKGKIKVVNYLAKKNNILQLNVDIKAQKDSLIWISIKAPFTSMEISRIQITKDSVYYINRIQKEFFIKHVASFEKYLDKETTITDLYNVLTASPKVEKDEYSLSSEKENYVLKSKRHQYIIEPKDYKIISGNIQEKIKYQFANYKKEDKYYFPQTLQLNLTNKEGDTEFVLEYSRVQFNQRQKISFKIPKHYAKSN